MTLFFAHRHYTPYQEVATALSTNLFTMAPGGPLTRPTVSARRLRPGKTAAPLPPASPALPGAGPLAPEMELKRQSNGALSTSDLRESRRKVITPLELR